MTIAVCEYDYDNSNAYSYFACYSNIELTILLFDKCSEVDAKEYFDSIANRIKTEGLTEITFKTTNDYFLKDEEKGIIPSYENKKGSDFNYRLKLPSLAHATNSKLISGNVNLLNLTALKVKQFKTSESHKAAVA